MISKSALRESMLALEKEKLSFSEKAYAEYLGSAKRDSGEPQDHHEFSVEFAESEVAQAFETTLHSHIDAISKLRTIDFSPKTVVEEGAIIFLRDRWFVIAVATTQFDCDGTPFMGISTDAPLFKAMEGKGPDDWFTWAGKEFRISVVA
jgi:hypothetical protein